VKQVVLYKLTVLQTVKQLDVNIKVLPDITIMVNMYPVKYQKSRHIDLGAKPLVLRVPTIKQTQQLVIMVFKERMHILTIVL
jgi:hypothetical protein